MKSNIQKMKEVLKAQLKDAEYKLFAPCSNDYIGFELNEKDEDGEYYFDHIDAFSTKEEIIEFLKTPVSKIRKIVEWYAGYERGGCEYVTDKENYGKLTINTIM